MENDFVLNDMNSYLKTLFVRLSVSKAVGSYLTLCTAYNSEKEKSSESSFRKSAAAMSVCPSWLPFWLFNPLRTTKISNPLQFS